VGSAANLSWPRLQQKIKLVGLPMVLLGRVGIDRHAANKIHDGSGRRAGAA
jgi:hypothetical protein